MGLQDLGALLLSPSMLTAYLYIGKKASCLVMGVTSPERH